MQMDNMHLSSVQSYLFPLPQERNISLRIQ